MRSPLSLKSIHLFLHICYQLIPSQALTHSHKLHEHVSIHQNNPSLSIVRTAGENSFNGQAGKAGGGRKTKRRKGGKAERQKGGQTDRRKGGKAESEGEGVLKCLIDLHGHNIIISGNCFFP